MAFGDLPWGQRDNGQPLLSGPLSHSAGRFLPKGWRDLPGLKGDGQSPASCRVGKSVLAELEPLNVQGVSQLTLQPSGTSGAVNSAAPSSLVGPPVSVGC